MTIYLLVEGPTETALKEHIKEFLDRRAKKAGTPKIRLKTSRKMSRSQDVIRKEVRFLLSLPETEAVVGLIDVYPHFQDAQTAKDFLRLAVPDEPKFFAHAAQFDVEAWLLPYWADICKRLKTRQPPPSGNPELVNQLHPPSKRLADLYRRVNRTYTKPIEMAAILQGKDLAVAARQCAELKALLNTLLTLHNLTPL